MTRYALRRDENEAEIVAALRNAGATVWPLGKPVDLLLGITGANGPTFALVEIKDGNKVPSARKKTDLQQRFFDLFAGYPVCLVDSVECALRHLSVLRGSQIVAEVTA